MIDRRTFGLVFVANSIASHRIKRYDDDDDDDDDDLQQPQANVVDAEGVLSRQRFVDLLQRFEEEVDEGLDADACPDRCVQETAEGRRIAGGNMTPQDTTKHGYWVCVRLNRICV